jgi:hypothetical protein
VNPNGQATPQERRRQRAEEIANAAANLTLVMVQSLNQQLGLFWDEQHDPQKLADEIDKQKGVGTTKTLFTRHAELASFVALKVPALAGSIHKRPDTYDVVFNADDSVTITEKEE